MVLLLLTWLAAAADLRLSIEASVSADLTTIEGEIRVDDVDVELIDPLAALPIPPDDRTLLRTARGRLRPGRVAFEAIGPGAWRFQTTLPRSRFDDIGAWRGRALFANGAWYPQPLVNGRAPIVHWEVKVELPAEVTGVLGENTGEGRVAWTGEAERVSLAAVRRARVESIQTPEAKVVIVDRRRRRRIRRMLRRDPATLLARARGDAPGRSQTALVVTPSRRRLARSGPGLVYLSDRTWRLTPGLRRYHDDAVTEALLDANLQIADPFERALAASLLARTTEGPGPRGLLKWFSWNPVIDAILNDRRMPFWGDIFTAPHPEDPLRDDLVERFRPHGPTRALVDQLALAHSPAALRELGTSLAAGTPLAEATGPLAPDARTIEAWRGPYPTQDYGLSVDADGVEITRDAPEEAPPEILAIRIQGETRVERVGAGPGRLQIPTEGRPGRVVLDPRGLTRQTSRVGDAYPPRLVLLWAAWIDAINLTEGFISGHAVAWARGRDDNRNTASLWIQADQQDLPAITLGWAHRRGPAQDGLQRAHRLSLSTTTAWSNPAFAPGDEPVFTLSAAASYAWDTRVSALFPVRGRRFFIGASGGIAPGQKTRWGRASTGFTGIVSPHPRHALVGRAHAAIATGDTPQRLLWLGGAGAGASLPPGIMIGDRRLGGQAEWRWAPVRNASLSLLDLAWLSEIQLTGGAEAVVLRTGRGETAHLFGLTAGTAVVADVLGANPGTLGITVGLPARVEGVQDDEGESVEPWGSPQINLRFGQAF